MADEISGAIQTNAVGPKRVSGDAGSVEQHSLQDQIEADKYVASKNAATNPLRGLRVTKMIPPGTV